MTFFTHGRLRMSEREAKRPARRVEVLISAHPKIASQYQQRLCSSLSMDMVLMAHRMHATIPRWLGRALPRELRTDYNRLLSTRH